MEPAAASVGGSDAASALADARFSVASYVMGAGTLFNDTLALPAAWIRHHLASDANLVALFAKRMDREAFGVMVRHFAPGRSSPFEAVTALHEQLKGEGVANPATHYLEIPADLKPIMPTSDAA